jgi:hypothetical protein
MVRRWSLIGHFPILYYPQLEVPLRGPLTSSPAFSDSSIVLQAAKAGDYFDEVKFLRGQVDNFNNGYKRRLMEMESGSKEQIMHSSALLKTRLAGISHEFKSKVAEMEASHLTQMQAANAEHAEMKVGTATHCSTAMKQLRIVILRFGTARHKMVLE